MEPPARKQPQFDENKSGLPVSPLCDIEILAPEDRWEPGLNRGSPKGGDKFLRYVRSKNPGLAPHGWKDITPYFGKQWPKSLSSWRTHVAKHGYYISVKIITNAEGLTYRAIFVCLNPK